MSPTGKPRPKKSPPPPTPKRSKAWDIPPFPKRGDRRAQKTHAEVGLALSQWEYLEGNLGILFGYLVDAPDELSPALRAYGTISSFSTRNDMLREATSAFFFRRKNDELRQKTITLLDESKNFSPRRNEIAHGIVQPYYAGGLAPTGFAVAPSRFSTRKKKLTIHALTEYTVTADAYAYTSVELRSFTEHFCDLALEVERVYLDIADLGP